MALFIVLAAMKGQFLSVYGNGYDNFQMLGYIEAASPDAAVVAFFDQPPFPIRWEDVEYLWAEQLSSHPANGHHGEYDRIYIDSLRQRFGGSG